MEQLCFSSRDGCEIGNGGRVRVYLDEPLEAGIDRVQLGMFETRRGLVDVRAPDNLLCFSEAGDRVPVAFLAEVAQGAYTLPELAAALAASLNAARCLTTHDPAYTTPRHTYAVRLSPAGRLVVTSPSGGEFGIHARRAPLHHVDIKPLDAIRVRLSLPSDHGLVVGAPLLLGPGIEAMVISISSEHAIALASKPLAAADATLYPRASTSSLASRLGFGDRDFHSTCDHTVLSVSSAADNVVGLDLGPVPWFDLVKGDVLDQGMVRAVPAPGYIALDAAASVRPGDVIRSLSMVCAPHTPVRGRAVRLWLERHECCCVRRPHGPRVFAMLDPEAGGDVALPRALHHIRWIDFEITDDRGRAVRGEDWTVNLFVFLKSAS